MISFVHEFCLLVLLTLCRYLKFHCALGVFFVNASRDFLVSLVLFYAVGIWLFPGLISCYILSLGFSFMFSSKRFLTLRKKCRNTKFFLVRIFPYSRSWRRPISYRNQSTDLHSKSMDWFLYDVGLRHESEYGKMRTRKNSVFGHFLRSVPLSFRYCISCCKGLISFRKESASFLVSCLRWSWNF